MSTRSKGLDAALVLILVFFVLAPLEAIITSRTASQLWDWFIKETYGPGPGLGVWYGAATIVFVARFSSVQFLREMRKQDDDMGPFAHVAVHLGVISVVMGFTLVGGWIVKNMLGW